MMLCGAEKTGGKGNYEKHALRASQVIAASTLRFGRC
jgi:hypothetical protein